jgi:hypothetical protein
MVFALKVPSVPFKSSSFANSQRLPAEELPI